MSLYRTNYEVKDFKIIKFIRSDYLGELYIAEDSVLKTKVFLRVFTDISLTSELDIPLMEEAKKQVKLHHENILTLNSMIIYDERICLIFSYSEGEFLSDILKDYDQLSEKKTLTIVRDLCQSLHDSHMHGLINGNLTPDDVIVAKDKSVKIMNFNWRELLIPYMKNDVLSEFYLYRAPELFKESILPTIKSDLYSLGLIMHQLLFGKLPYEKGNSLVQLYENVKTPTIEKSEKFTHEVSAIFDKLLAYEPGNRYNQPFNLITVLNNFLFMREELFDTHKSEVIDLPIPVYSSQDNAKEDTEEVVENTKPQEVIDTVQESEEDTSSSEEESQLESIDQQSEEVVDGENVGEKLEIAFYKNKYQELTAGYKRVLTLAGLAFVLMVLMLVFFPESIGAWLLGQY